VKHSFVCACLLIMSFVPLSALHASASSIWYVDGVNGNDTNDCKSLATACKTINHSIQLASSGDSIRVAAATYSENLVINISLSIGGVGENTTTIKGGESDTVVVAAGAQMALSGLTISHSPPAGSGRGIFNSGVLTVTNSIISGNGLSETCEVCAEEDGGGIFNQGVLTLTRTTISNNFVSAGCTSAVCGKHVTSGGGIYNFGTLTMRGSTVSGNSSEDDNTHCSGCYAYGGGISNQGTLTLTTSTIIGNSASGNTNEGGGIYSVSIRRTRLTIVNSTITQNTSTFGGGIASDPATVSNSTIAGNDYGNVLGPVVLQNSILEDSGFRDNCIGTEVSSNGFNISSDGTCNFAGPGDLNNTDPKVGTLGNHGGPTQTIPLMPRSPAIDAGNPAGCTDSTGHLLKTDQRGAPRPDREDSGGCDIGAYERQSD